MAMRLQNQLVIAVKDLQWKWADMHGNGERIRFCCSRCTTEEATVIQQVIRCDMCGRQKRQANHWFVAREEPGELRITGWNSHQLLSPQTKHLCGETCAHKLLSHSLMKLADDGAHGAAVLPADTAVSPPDGDTPSRSMGKSSPITFGSADYGRLDTAHPCAGRRAS